MEWVIVRSSKIMYPQSKWGLMKNLYVVTSNLLRIIIWSLRDSPMGLLNLLVMNLKFFPKFNLSSKNTPRCFWHGVFAVSNNDISRKCNSCQRSFLEKRRVNQYFQSCLGAKSKDWTVYEKQPPDTEESLDNCQLRRN